MKKVFCERCKRELTEDDIAYSQYGEMTYKVLLGKDKNGNRTIDFEENEFISDEVGEFYCRHCGYPLDRKQIKLLDIPF